MMLCKETWVQDVGRNMAPVDTITMSNMRHEDTREDQSRSKVHHPALLKMGKVHNNSTQTMHDTRNLAWSCLATYRRATVAVESQNRSFNLCEQKTNISTWKSSLQMKCSFTWVKLIVSHQDRLVHRARSGSTTMIIA
jgi:hypothetical protein